MRHVIGVREARALLRSRRQLLELGHTERGIRARMREGVFMRVRRGWYIGGQVWQQLWPEGRHLLHVVAVDADAVDRRPVFSDASAAALHGLPLYRTSVDRVHVALGEGASRSMPDVLRHRSPLAFDDVVEVDGLLCTSPTRTVLDVTRSFIPEAAVACADAALRAVAVVGHEQDEDAAAEWRDRLLRRAASSSARGVRQSRRTILFADGRAQLPGASVSRLQLARLGFRRIGLQAAVTLPDGAQYLVDFDLEEAEAFGEFDGRGKYLDEKLRGGRTIEEVVLDEKRREDSIRGVTGRRFVRWGFDQIVTPEALGARLAEFGIRPPAWT